MNAMPQDLRTIAMLDWLEHDLLLTINHCEPASSDASFRRYFRITTPEGKFIVMDAPPPQENVEAFIRIAELLTHLRVHVPSIYKINIIDGFLLLEDFGSFCFLEKINDPTIVESYKTAFDSLFVLQTQTPIENTGLPSYNAELLQRELTIFEEWFLGHLIDVPIPSALWQSTCKLLINSALEQPSICVHRDYHSRNLMVLAGDSLGILDFQDAVIGPITYDLVSLLRDCYIALPEQQVHNWMLDYYQRLRDAQLGASSWALTAIGSDWLVLDASGRFRASDGGAAWLHYVDEQEKDSLPNRVWYAADIAFQMRSAAVPQRRIKLRRLPKAIGADRGKAQ